MLRDQPASAFTDSTVFVGEWKDEASRLHNRCVFNDVAVPTDGNAPFTTSNMGTSNGLRSDNQDPTPSDSLFSNQDPWNLRRDMQFPVPRICCPDSSGELSMAAQIKEGGFYQTLEDLNKDTPAETIRFVKGKQFCNSELFMFFH